MSLLTSHTWLAFRVSIKQAASHKLPAPEALYLRLLSTTSCSLQHAGPHPMCQAAPDSCFTRQHLAQSLGPDQTPRAVPYRPTRAPAAVLRPFAGIAFMGSCHM